MSAVGQHVGSGASSVRPGLGVLTLGCWRRGAVWTWALRGLSLAFAPGFGVGWLSSLICRIGGSGFLLGLRVWHLGLFHLAQPPGSWAQAWQALMQRRCGGLHGTVQHSFTGPRRFMTVRRQSTNKAEGRMF